MSTNINDSPLSNDIIIEIFNVADWRTVMSMKQVSQSWHRLSKTWSVWSSLVLRETLSSSDCPAGHILEKPIEQYTQPDLETLFVRWKQAEMILQGRIPAATRTKSFQMSLPEEHRLLLPGGRWLIAVCGPAAWYFDLDRERPDAHALFATQILGSHPTLAHTGYPCLQHDINLTTVSEGLNVHMAYSFFDNSSSTWIVQVWNIRTSGPGLRASLRTAMKFRVQPQPNYFSGSCMCESLTEDMIAVNLRNMDGSSFLHTSLVQWQTMDVDAGLDFRRVTLPNVGADKIVIVPGQKRLLGFTKSLVYLDDFSNVTERYGYPTEDELRADADDRRRKELLSNSNSVRQTFSRPYAFFRGPRTADSPITIRVIALNNYHCRLLGMELDIPFSDFGDSTFKFAARYAHLGALPAEGLTDNILLRHGHASVTYRRSLVPRGEADQRLTPDVNSYCWASHWGIGKHNVRTLKAVEALSDRLEFQYGDLVDMDEGTARFITVTYQPQMVHVIDFVK